jgi:biotin transporter BioY
MLVIWGSGKAWKTEKNWQSSLLALAGIVMIVVILWLLLQVMIGVPSLAQTVDLPAIFLGLLIAYGFQNAVHTLRERAKNKFK